ncbi:MAG: YcxB family protein [Chlorobi bacterium]|nr:YcxB family protein [Chlorobiota bacterium]
MTIDFEFDFEIEDWMAFQKSYMENSKQFKRTRAFAAYTIPAMLSVSFIIDLLRTSITLEDHIIHLLFIIIWIPFARWLINSSTLRKFRKMLGEGDNSSILGLHRLILNEDGLQYFKPDSEGKMKWSAFKKLVQTEDYYFLYNSAISAMIIPKKKVDVDLGEFLRTHVAQ